MHDLGLDERVHRSDDRARRRFIFRGGRLHALPGGPGAFLGERPALLAGQAAHGRRALRAPRAPRATRASMRSRPGGSAGRPPSCSSTRWSPASSRGDARALSLRACFPKMWQMETDHGGLFRALLAKMREKRIRRGDALGSPLGRLTSFRDGTEELVAALVAIPGAGRASRHAGDRPARDGFRLARRGGRGAGVEADAVVLAAPPSASARASSPPWTTPSPSSSARSLRPASRSSPSATTSAGSRRPSTASASWSPGARGRACSASCGTRASTRAGPPQGACSCGP